MTTLRPYTPSEGDRFGRCLLLVLSWGDSSLTDAISKAEDLARTRYNAPLTIRYSTFKRVKNELIYSGLIAQSKVGRSYRLTLTDAGKVRVEEIESEAMFTVEHEGVKLLEPPYRVGAGHMMPREMWSALMVEVKAGAVDLIVVPRQQHTKSGYWDEASRGRL